MASAADRSEEPLFPRNSRSNCPTRWAPGGCWPSLMLTSIVNVDRAGQRGLPATPALHRAGALRQMAIRAAPSLRTKSERAFALSALSLSREAVAQSPEKSLTLQRWED